MPFPAVFDVSTLDGSNGFVIRTVSFAGVNFSVAAAGDFNGDGVGDLIIGSPSLSDDGVAAYVVYGVPGERSALFSLGAMTAEAGVRVLALFDSHDAGESPYAGDFNNDGRPDIALGGSQPIHNEAYLLLNPGAVVGGAISLGTTVSTVYTGDGPALTSLADINGDGYDDLIISAVGSPFDVTAAGVVYGTAAGLPGDVTVPGLDGVVGFRFAAANYYDMRITSAGDVNNDGFEDLIYSSARFFDGLQGGAGIIFGKAAPFAVQAPPPADGLQGFQVNTHGEQILTIASAGDLNNDGFDDMVFAAPTAGAGSVYVVFGKGAAYPPLFDLANLDGTNGFKLTGPAAGGRLGNTVSSAGDVNGDGIDDLLVGSYATGAVREAYVLYGKTAGFAANFDLSGLDGTNGFIIRGPASQYSQLAVSAVGDVNGDGADDIAVTNAIVGVVNLNETRDSYIIFGQAVAQTFVGAATDDSFTGAGGADDISGGAGKDILRGMAGADLIDGGDNADVLYGGDGADDILGGQGGDVLYGEIGDDRLAGGTEGDKLFGGAGLDNLAGDDGNDRLDGGIGADILSGGDGNDYLDGGAGADTISGGLGNDVYVVTDGLDTLSELAGQGYDVVRTGLDGWVLGANFEALELQGSGDIDGFGNGEANNLQGNGGDNLLDGGAGVDTINGADGDDIIVGGFGNDLLRGGLGADVFRVAHTPAGGLEIDQVYDFSAAEGDTLDLSGAYGGTLQLVSSFGKHAGEMTLTFAGGITTLRLDLNGDGRVDYQMKLNGDVTGESGDWLL